jgi:Lrp/AsnC family leucine-responsive transcriptional regulator
MEIDEIDAKILQMLQTNGRLSFREIAKKTGISTPTVSARVKSLEERGVIRGYSIDIDPAAVNETVSVLTLRCKPKDLETVSELLAGQESVREVMVLSGSKIVARLVFETEGKLDEFLRWLEKLDQIDNYDIERAVRMVKKEPDAIVMEGVQIVIPCYECRKPITDNPVTAKIDDRTHYLCCGSCLKLYKDRYSRIKKGASAPKGGH